MCNNNAEFTLSVSGYREEQFVGRFCAAHLISEMKSAPANDYLVNCLNDTAGFNCESASEVMNEIQAVKQVYDAGIKPLKSAVGFVRGARVFNAMQNLNVNGKTILVRCVDNNPVAPRYTVKITS